jgi:aerobic-type carbon monoxide dehydrogenase small subunit (CoxS/CutS family)
VSERVDITLVLNGETRMFLVPPGRRLLDLLREDAGLTGTKEGCGAGECGACTVLLDGKPVPSCVVMAGSCHGHEVVSVEGLAAPGHLHPFQEAMVREGGVQCGFCTPGVVITGAAILAAGERDESEWARLLSGNLCRCTGYRKIFAALAAASGDDHA